MSNSDLVDIYVTKHAETEKAVLVSTGRKEDAVWLPKSQIEIIAPQPGKALFVVTLPEWLAEDKELL